MITTFDITFPQLVRIASCEWSCGPTTFTQKLWSQHFCQNKINKCKKKRFIYRKDTTKPIIPLVPLSVTDCPKHQMNYGNTMRVTTTASFIYIYIYITATASNYCIKQILSCNEVILLSTQGEACSDPHRMISHHQLPTHYMLSIYIIHINIIFVNSYTHLLKQR